MVEGLPDRHTAIYARMRRAPKGPGGSAMTRVKAIGTSLANKERWI